MTAPILQQLPLFSNEPETITIPLTQGQQTIISAIDADLANLKWQAQWCKSYGGGGKYFVRRSYHVPGHKWQKAMLMHRVIMQRVLGRELVKGEMVDHINGDPLCNIRENLRLANGSENNWNAEKRKDNKSGYKGVSWSKQYNEWVANIQVNKKQIKLGRFPTPEEAHAAYCEAAKKYHGEFANFG